MSGRRGMAMLGALMVMLLLTIMVMATLTLTAADKRQAIRHVRTESREQCAFAGLNYARTYFAGQLPQWNTYFSNPNHYNPLSLPPITTPPWLGGQVAADIVNLPTLSAIRAARPELFLDLDSDGASDVYVFIRDNDDEFAPAQPNYQQDNDQNALIGAVCISNTMQPRKEDDKIDTNYLLMESLLSVNLGGGGAWQVGSDGNVNN